MAEATMSRDLTQGSVFKQMVKFAIPLMLANILQIVYTLTDMVIIGRFVGPVGISAVGNGGEITTFFTNFSMGLCSAGQIVISQYLGKKDKKGISSTVGTMFSFISVFSLCLTAVSLFVADWFIRILNTPTEAVVLCHDYTVTCFAGLFFIFGYNSVSAMLRGMGDSRRPLVFVAIAATSNILFDLLFVGVFKWQTFGAAIATVIGQGLSFIFSLVYLFKKREAFGFDFKRKSFRINRSILGNLIKLGIPMALNSTAICISGFYVSSLINKFGIAASAVAGIGSKMRAITAVFSNSFSTASSTMVGQSIGRGLYDRIKKIFWCCFSVLLVTCGILGAIGAVFPRTLFGLFGADEAVLELAPKFMLINLVTCFAFAFMMPGTSLIHGIGYAKLAFITGMIDGFVTRIGLVWLFYSIFDLGLWGIWWAATLAAFANAAITWGYFLSGKWKYRKAVVKEV